MLASLSIQVQPHRATLNMSAVTEAFAQVARHPLARRHQFDQGHDRHAYFNFTFGTEDADALWAVIRADIYSRADLAALADATIVTRTGERGWDDYKLLMHFDPTVPLDVP